MFREIKGYIMKKVQPKLIFPVNVLENIIWENQEYLESGQVACGGRWSGESYATIPGFLEFSKDLEVWTEDYEFFNKKHMGSKDLFKKQAKLRMLIQRLNHINNK